MYQKTQNESFNLNKLDQELINECSKKNSSAEKIIFLLKQGADPNFQNHDNFNAIICYIRYAEKPCQEVIQQFYEYKGNIFINTNDKDVLKQDIADLCKKEDNEAFDATIVRLLKNLE
ncbi:MAG: hypothetical protein HYX60_05780, partial [Legionella longbeachae]|nr:hypothetical protein [Legionella longbeachae]